MISDDLHVHRIRSVTLNHITSDPIYHGDITSVIIGSLDHHPFSAMPATSLWPRLLTVFATWQFHVHLNVDMSDCHVSTFLNHALSCQTQPQSVLHPGHHVHQRIVVF